MAKSKDNLDGEYVGVVVYNKDPEKSGRCKVRVFNLLDDIADDLLPWASPKNPGTVFASKGNGCLSVPKIGTMVRVSFNGGSIYNPEYISILHIDTDLINEIKDDYLGTHVLLYDSDQELSVIFQPSSGIRVYFKESYFQITPDNMITLCHANNTSIIQMQGSTINIVANSEINVLGNDVVNLKGKVVNVNGTESVSIKGNSPGEVAVNGKALMTVLESLANIVDQKVSSSPGLAAGIVNASKPAVLNTKINLV